MHLEEILSLGGQINWVGAPPRHQPRASPSLIFSLRTTWFHHTHTHTWPSSISAISAISTQWHTHKHGQDLVDCWLKFCNFETIWPPGGEWKMESGEWRVAPPGWHPPPPQVSAKILIFFFYKSTTWKVRPEKCDLKSATSNQTDDVKFWQERRGHQPGNFQGLKPPLPLHIHSKTRKKTPPGGQGIHVISLKSMTESTTWKVWRTSYYYDMNLNF